MRFEGKTVLITGASLGIGRSAAKMFASEGANVVLCARRQGPLDAALDTIGKPDQLHAITCDVGGDASMLEGLVQASVERFGALHGLVNNAGAHFRGALMKRTPEEVGTMVDVNLRAPLMLTRIALPHLQKEGGFVINVASLAGKVPLDGAATYSSTKFGLRAFTYALAEELHGTNVTVSAVSPGPVDTGFIMDDLDEVEDIALSQTICTADDVARMILDCAADGRREREFPVSGGKLATLAYLAPGLRRVLKPRLVARGAAQKARIRKERGE